MNMSGWLVLFYEPAAEESLLGKFLKEIKAGDMACG